MKIAVLTLSHGYDYKQITKYGRLSKIQYCNRHGYDFFDEIDIDTSRPIAWSKILLILKHIDNYDYVVWIDADTYIMNPDKKIDDIIETWSDGKDILCARDWKIINSGVLFIKNTDWCKKFWKDIYDMTDFINHPNWEQGAFIHCIEQDKKGESEHITVLPVDKQTIFNSYWYNYCVGDFIIHFAGCYRDNTDRGLWYTMQKYCPIRTDEDSEESYKERMRWLKEDAIEDAKGRLAGKYTI